MCRSKTITDHKKFRLADFFDQNWAAYVKNPKHYITPEQYKAVAAMRACRTEALGIDHYACEECGEISKIYHSCKNRFCPTCSWKDTLDWADKIKDEMLDLPHRHAVFTLPHRLNNLINDNKYELLSILCQTAADTIKDWMMHKYKLKPGIISVLHTFGETKELHPHIHMIVSWGGIDKNGHAQEIMGEFIKYDFIQSKFRCKFEDKLVKLFDDNALVSSFKNRMDFMRFLKMVNDKKWRIHFEAAMRVPAEVIRYIGRYSKRACISEYKITNIDGAYISFNYKDNKNLDYKGKPIVKVLTLHYNKFFPRLLQHVPLPYFRLVRYYGAYAARTKAMLKENHSAFQEKIEQDNKEVEEYEMPQNNKVCSNCNKEKKYLFTTFKNRDSKIIYMTRFSHKEKNNKPNENAA